MEETLLEKQRKLKGWSQSNVGSYLDVSTKTIASWESRQTKPKRPMCTLIALLLGGQDTDYIEDFYGEE